MAEEIQRYTHAVQDAQGRSYTAVALGAERPDGSWEGWLEFHPENATLPTLRTGRESSQANREDLLYWASGLEPAYLDGALGRAEAVG